MGCVQSSSSEPSNPHPCCHSTDKEGVNPAAETGHRDSAHSEFGHRRKSTDKPRHDLDVPTGGASPSHIQVQVPPPLPQDPIALLLGSESCPGQYETGANSCGSSESAFYQGRSSAEASAAACSGRSSFAQDAAPKLAHSASSSTGRNASLGSVQESLSLATGHSELLQTLVALPSDVPVPLSLLQCLWRSKDMLEARQAADDLAACGVLRITTLSDGSTWCLLASELQDTALPTATLSPEAASLLHTRVVSFYNRNGATLITAVRDDGYFMANIAHHLAASGQLPVLKCLLMEPCWLESKLHAYGVGAVVADFRRYLSVNEDAEVKLLLQSFQLSLGACTEHPRCKILRQQMLARLMAVARVTQLKDWYEQQVSKCAAEDMLAAGRSVVHLMPRTASLEQAGTLHRMALRGHKAAVRKVLISPNGRDIVTISDDGSAQLWDMNIGDCVVQLARDQPLTAMDLAPDGVSCVVTCEDSSCCIWDLASGNVRQVLKGHTAKVNAVAVDQQGLRCVTASDDQTVRVWSMYNGQCEQVHRGHGGGGQVGAVFDVAISADGVLAASVSDDFTCRVWDLDEDCALHVLEGHSAWVCSVQFLGSSHRVVTASQDSTARVWDASQGRCLHVLSGHTGRLNKVTVDPAGVYAVTASDDFTARVWDLEQGRCLFVLTGHDSWVNDAAINRDRTKIVTVSGDHTARIWDMASGCCQAVLEGHSGDVTAVQLTYGGRFAVTASADSTARVWDLAACQLQLQEHPSGHILGLQPVPCSCQVAAISEDGHLRVYNAAAGTCELDVPGTGSPLRYLQVNDDCSSAVAGCADRQVSLWQLSDGQCLGHIPGYQGSRVKSMAFSADGRRAVIVLYDSTVAVWDTQTGEVLSQLIKRGERDGTRVHSGGVNAACMTRSGKVAVTVSKDTTARIWDTASGTCCACVTGHSDGIVAAAISADEQHVATAAYDCTVRLSLLSTGETIGIMDLAAAPTLLSFAPDGQHVAVATADHSVILWDLQTRNHLPALLGHTGEVTGMAFSAAGDLLLTCSLDCTVRVWRAGSGKQLAFFMADAGLTSCCFAGHPVSDIVVAGDVNGALHFLDFPEEVQNEQFYCPYH